MRVLIVTDWNRGKGGAEAYVSWLRDGLRATGDEVRLLTSSAGSAGDGTAEYVAYGSEHMAAQAFLQIANPFAVHRIRSALTEFRPEIAFVNMFAHHLSPAILHALAGVHTVLSVTDYKCVCPIGSKLLPDGTLCRVRAGWVCRENGCVSLPHWIRDLPRYALLRSGVARVCKVLACSEWVRRELALDGIDSQCVMLPVPAVTAGFNRAAADYPHFLFCARLDIEKGADVLIRAFAIVMGKCPLSRLVIVGPGPQRERLEALAAELGVSGAIVFTGWLNPPEVEKELSRAWALVTPSLWAEPLGLIALDAIVRGVPVIASASGGLAEIVEDGVTGLFFPNGDVAALAERMLEIASRARFGNHRLPADAVRKAAERHDMGRHIERMRTIFAETARMSA